MRAVPVALAVFCVVLSVLFNRFSFFLPEPNPQVEQNIKQEMVAPSKHALVVGASSGIGLAVAKELAPIVAKLTLCSRSYPEELLKTIKENNPNVEVVHEKLDVSLMHEVRKFTKKHANTQFDWIVMSPGIMTLNGRTETPEGLDVKMATHYYGRFMLVHDLLEGLNRPGVRVLNIFAAGHGGAIDMNDLDLKHTYSGKRCADATTQYSDLMTQAFSEHASKASFMHAMPGFVNTGLSKGLPWYLRGPANGLAALFGRSPEACGKVMVSALLNDDYVTGWRLLDYNGKVASTTKYHTEEAKEVVWKHTVKTIEDIMKQ
ncbi:hypothetical protein F442_05857 [Phytophthora nicotianae P10297]|uniref:Oxidoreductase n=4 Tax=Phytophthora nicotianae TaxID=4792 RepID=V9FHU5_PHYNI|nr:hypothetical protein F443_05812 [Phytophthora nicotianae P1569]ETL97192.1 hypothetical protein L917_05504 [Phytophthora nicotianae]ETM50346.1 hypothetical protein L914_05622 [Phytophthora nicotianae]ETO79437.1 hypothetical protein F444_05860 [Phytophthora nicotianae P1976]ETP48440.1 hypothetical protein F442_05857 [Phytophthora nicotianae P10297]